MPTSAGISLDFSNYSRMWASALLNYCPIPPHPNPLPQAPKGEGTAMLVLLNFRFRPDELAILSCDGESDQGQVINVHRGQRVVEKHKSLGTFDLQALSRIWVGD